MRVERLSATDPPQLGPWRLVGRIGSGGMGVVYLGTREARGRTQDAAVKVISADLVGSSTALARFRREIAALMSLEDPGVARVLAADLDDEPPWYAADLVDGPTLARAVRERGPVPALLWPSLALTLACTLARLHARGIIHRDLKPRNILLGPAGPVVIDFGISAVAGATSLTTTGDSPRSEFWASPEQLRNEEATPATDVFAAGTLLTWAATGRHPFAAAEAHTTEGLLHAILTAAPRLDGVSSDALPWLTAMLDKDPTRRPRAGQLIDTISEVAPDLAAARAATAQRHGWTSAARGWWQVAADAGRPDALAALGDLASADGDTDAARSWWQLARDARPPDVPSPLTLPGAEWVSHERTGDPTSAVAAAPGRARRANRLMVAAALATVAVAVGVVGWAGLRPDAPRSDPQRAPDTLASSTAQLSTRPVPVALPQGGPAGRAVRIAVGDTSACVLTADGRARCWGSDSAGQLGSPGGDADAPREVTSTGVLAGTELRRIAVGAAHACALDSAGRAYCWGSNDHGQLGVDKRVLPASDEPVRTDSRGALSGRSLEFIGTAGSTTCALDTSGDLFCWGDNGTGQLGNGTNASSDTPVAVESSEGPAEHQFRRFAVGGDHTCAVDRVGDVYCWGANDRGQLGTGSGAASLVPVRAASPDSTPQGAYASVNLGTGTTCATTREGRAVCWGANDHGQLGIGTVKDGSVPQRVASPLGAMPVDRVSVSGSTACSVSTGGRAYCWGANANGQLGDGSLTDASIPVAVADPADRPLPSLPIVAAGPVTTCAVDVDGGAWCWGSDRRGLLGRGTD